MSDATELLSKPPDKILEYINQNYDNINVDCDFNWHLVAEIAAGNAMRFSEIDRVAALSWATASVIIYDRLEATVGPKEFQSFGLSAAEVRSNTILSLGPVPGHLVLDPENLENWFFRRAGMTLDEARELVRRWDNLSSNDMSRLLNLRDCYQAINILHNRGFLQRTQELSEWQSVLERLTIALRTPRGTGTSL
jgi:hypothetical protein